MADRVRLVLPLAVGLVLIAAAVVSAVVVGPAVGHPLAAGLLGVGLYAVGAWVIDRHLSRRAMPAADDGMRCEPVYGDDGEVIAVARVSPDMDERGREALAEVVAAARRLAEQESAADPGRAERQRAAIERIRERSQRWRAEDSARRWRFRFALAAGLALVGLGLWVLAAGGPVWGWSGLVWLGVLTCAVGTCQWVLECADAARGER